MPSCGDEHFAVLKRAHACPGSISLIYGSSLTHRDLEAARASRMAPSEAAAIPFPNEETTPPVTKTNRDIRRSRRRKAAAAQLLYDGAVQTSKISDSARQRCAIQSSVASTMRARAVQSPPTCVDARHRSIRSATATSRLPRRNRAADAARSAAGTLCLLQQRLQRSRLGPPTRGRNDRSPPATPDAPRASFPAADPDRSGRAHRGVEGELEPSIVRQGRL